MILANGPGGAINTLENLNVARFEGDVGDLNHYCRVCCLLFIWFRGDNWFKINLHYFLIASVVSSIFSLAVMGSVFGG